MCDQQFQPEKIITVKLYKEFDYLYYRDITLEYKLCLDCVKKLTDFLNGKSDKND